MMLFDPKAALAEIRNQGSTPATPATFATQPPETTPNVAKVANVATLKPEKPKNDHKAKPAGPDDMRHGFTINGHPKTWTGNVVRLEDWRGLTEWQKHGPNGRMWCGACQDWKSDCQHMSGRTGQ